MYALFTGHSGVDRTKNPHAWVLYGIQIIKVSIWLLCPCMRCIQSTVMSIIVLFLHECVVCTEHRLVSLWLIFACMIVTTDMMQLNSMFSCCYLGFNWWCTPASGISCFMFSKYKKVPTKSTKVELWILSKVRRFYWIPPLEKCAARYDYQIILLSSPR